MNVNSSMRGTASMVANRGPSLGKRTTYRSETARVSKWWTQGSRLITLANLGGSTSLMREGSADLLCGFPSVHFCQRNASTKANRIFLKGWVRSRRLL